MARIGSAISGIERRLLDSLALANAQVTLSNLRMATGHKINSPKDDPSAFVTLSGLQSQLNVVTATLSNATAADSMIAQTHTALGGIQTQLNTIRTELLKDTDAAHPLTSAQRAESQAIIDTAIDQINTLAGTSINGKMLLGGSADYIYSGGNSTQVADVIVHSKPQSDAAISGEVISTAEQAKLTYTGEIAVVRDTTLTLTGERGSVAFTVHTTDTLDTVADTINQNSYKTGITAAVDSGAHTLTLTSVDYGASAFVRVSTDGDFPAPGGDGNGYATGTNASAVINGRTIDSSSNNVNGNRFSVNDNGMSFEIEFQPNLAPHTTFDTITVEGKALSFALSTSLNQPATLSVPAVYSADLGGPSGRLDDLYSGGLLSGLGGNTAQAIRVVDEAMGQITRVQGSVDGFYNAAITSSSNLLSDLQTNLGTYIDSIDKVDDYEETQRKDYYQALADNAISGLMIVDQQRMSIVKMLQDIAGLSQTQG